MERSVDEEYWRLKYSKQLFHRTITKFFFPDDADTFAFYGPGHKTYFPDDYTRFSTMEEVMKKYVSEV